jgi:hypothetical protein
VLLESLQLLEELLVGLASELVEILRELEWSALQEVNDFVAVDFDKQLPFAVGIEQHPAAMPKQLVMMLLAYSNSQPVPLIVESLKC